MNKQVKFTIDNVKSVYSLLYPGSPNIRQINSVDITTGKRYYVLRLLTYPIGTQEIVIFAEYTNPEYPEIDFRDFQAIQLLPNEAKFEYLKSLIERQ